MSNTTAPKQVGLVAAITDMATGGAIALPNSTTIEQYRALTVNQTTAAQTLALPPPTDTSIVFSLTVSSIGSASFSLLGVTLAPDATSQYTWNGTKWTCDTELAAVTPPVPTEQTLTATTNNTVPALASTPKSGYPIMFWVNGDRVKSGLSVSGTTITVDAAALGFNISPTDSIDVLYWV